MRRFDDETATAVDEIKAQLRELREFDERRQARMKEHAPLTSGAFFKSVVTDRKDRDRMARDIRAARRSMSGRDNLADSLRRLLRALKKRRARS